jgi:hypothetical protein
MRKYRIQNVLYCNHWIYLNIDFNLLNTLGRRDSEAGEPLNISQIIKSQSNQYFQIFKYFDALNVTTLFELSLSNTKYVRNDNTLFIFSQWASLFWEGEQPFDRFSFSVLQYWRLQLRGQWKRRCTNQRSKLTILLTVPIHVRPASNSLTLILKNISKFSSVRIFLSSSCNRFYSSLFRQQLGDASCSLYSIIPNELCLACSQHCQEKHWTFLTLLWEHLSLMLETAPYLYKLFLAASECIHLQRRWKF